MCMCVREWMNVMTDCIEATTIKDLCILSVVIRVVCYQIDRLRLSQCARN